jgi:hypothetical protein
VTFRDLPVEQRRTLAALAIAFLDDDQDGALALLDGVPSDIALLCAVAAMLADNLADGQRARVRDTCEEILTELRSGAD